MRMDIFADGRSAPFISGGYFLNIISSRSQLEQSLYSYFLAGS